MSVSVGQPRLPASEAAQRMSEATSEKSRERRRRSKKSKRKEAREKKQKKRSRTQRTQQKVPTRQNSAERTSKAGVGEEIRETHGVRKEAEVENFVEEKEKKKRRGSEVEEIGKCEKGEINSLQKENFKGRLEMVELGSGGGKEDQVRALAVVGRRAFWDE